MRVLEIVAEALEVSVALRLAPPVLQVAGAVVANHSLGGVNFTDQLLNRARVQSIGLRKFSMC